MNKDIQVTVLGLCGNSVFMTVDHFHRPGETVSALGRYAEPGGKGYNQAVAAARLGAKTAFVTCIGDDSDGKMCMDFLQQEGILPLPQTEPGIPSAYACILTDKDGENRVTVFRGAADLLSPDFVLLQEDILARSKFLLLNNEYPQSCNEAAMALAKKHGVKVIYNPAPARPVSPEFLSGCYLITPNLSETAVLLGQEAADPKALASALRQCGIANAAVTLGGDGALLVTQDAALLYPARKVKALDTTGAGDTFTGALTAALLEDDCLERAVCLAINAAALSVSKQYVMPGLPTREALEADFQTIMPENLSTTGR